MLITRVENFSHFLKPGLSGKKTLRKSFIMKENTIG